MNAMSMHKPHQDILRLQHTTMREGGREREREREREGERLYQVRNIPGGETRQC